MRGTESLDCTKALRPIQQNVHFSVSDVDSLDTLFLEEHVRSDTL
jgi:hypothetical protein